MYRTVEAGRYHYLIFFEQYLLYTRNKLVAFGLRVYLLQDSVHIPECRIYTGHVIMVHIYDMRTQSINLDLFDKMSYNLNSLSSMPATYFHLIICKELKE